MRPAAAIILLLCLAAPVRGEGARLWLERQGEGPVAIGDTLVLDLVVEAEGQDLTSASAYVSFDERAFALVPWRVLGEGLVLPFSQGPFLVGTVYENSTAGDSLYGRGAGNGLEGFQLDYVVVSPAGSEGIRPHATGRGALARFRLLVVARPEGGVGRVRLDASGRRQPAYTLLQAPGVEQRFQVQKAPLEMAIGEGEPLVLEAPAEPPPVAPALEAGVLRMREDSGQERFPLEAFLPGGQVGAWEWEAEADPPLQGRVEGDALLLEAPADWHGRSQVHLRLRGQGQRAETRVEVVVEAVNDAPRIAPLDLLQVALGTRRQGPALERVLSDADHPLDALRLRLRFDEGVRVEEVDGFLFAEGLRAGRSAVQVEVEDPEGALASAAWAVEVVVLQIPLEWRALPALEMRVGEELQLELAAWVEAGPGAELVWQVEIGGALEGGLEEGGRLRLRARAAGEGRVRLRVRDTQGSEAVAVLVVEVGQGAAATADSASRAIPAMPGEEPPAAPQPAPGQGPGESPPAPGGEVAPPAPVSGGEPPRAPAPDEEAPAAPAPGGEGQTSPPAAGEEPQPLRLGDLPAVQVEAAGEVSLALGKYVEGGEGVLVWSVSGGAEIEAVVGEGDSLQVRASASFVGREVLVLSVEDGAGRRASAVLEVRAARALAPLRLGAPPVVELGAEGEVSLVVSDYVEGGEGALVWSVEGGVEVAARVSGEGVVQLRASASFAGDEVLVLSVEDGAGRRASAALRVRATEAGPAKPERHNPEGGAPQAGEAVLELGVPAEYGVLAGRVDSALAVDSWVVVGDPLAVRWSVRGGARVRAAIEGGRLHLDARDALPGREVFFVEAVAPALRRSAMLAVNVRAPRFALRSPPALLLGAGEAGALGLDSLVEGDFSPQEVGWAVEGSGGARGTIGPGRILRVEAESSGSLHLRARPPYGAEAVVEMRVEVEGAGGGAAPVAAQPGETPVAAQPGETPIAAQPEETPVVAQPGETPVVAQPGETPVSAPPALPPRLSLPGEVALSAGQVLNLELLASDADTPFAALSWEVEVEGEGRAEVGAAGLSLSGRADFVVRIAVRDPQGNAAEARIQVRVHPPDEKPPHLRVGGRVLADGALELRVQADEELEGAPLLLVGARPLALRPDGDGYAARYEPAGSGVLALQAAGRDRAGNEGRADLELSFAYMEPGTALLGPGGRVRLQALSATDGMAALLHAEPEGYRVDFAPGARLELVFAVAGAAHIERRAGGEWEAQPSYAIPGAVYAAVAEPGLYRTAPSAKAMLAPLAPVAFPNPFNAQVAIRYAVAEPGPVRLRVYDVRGRALRTLVEGFRQAGPWTAFWDGRDQEGRPAASGMYLLWLESSGQRLAGRVVLVR